MFQEDFYDASRVTTTVKINSKIYWKHQIKHIKSKFYCNVSVPAKTKHRLDQKLLHILYISLNLPIQITVQRHGDTYKSSFQPLVSLQKEHIDSFIMPIFK